MSEENRIRFAGLMEDYLNIPSFVCELIEKQLEDNKYKEVIEYVVQRRNEIENKEDYLSEQEKINKYLNLQQKVQQLEKENKRLKEWKEDLLSENIELENIRKEAIDLLIYVSYNIRGLEDKWLVHLIDEKLNILNKGSESNVKD